MKKSSSISYDSIQDDLGIFFVSNSSTIHFLSQSLNKWKSLLSEWSIRSLGSFIGDCSNCETGNRLTENDF